MNKKGDFSEILPAFVILYGMVIVSVWLIPAFMGFEGMSLVMKILTSVILIPIVLLILNKMNSG